MDCLFRSTRFTFDFAAPVEGAGTSLDHRHLLRPVAPAAAHQVAPVDAYRRVVALAAVCTENSQAQIFLAKSGGLLEVHQVLGSWRLVIRVVRLQRELVAIFGKKIKNYFLFRCKSQQKHLPVLLFVILPCSVHRICLSHIIRVLSDVFVPPVASRDLVLVVVSEAVADLHPRRSVEAVFERISDDSEVGQPHPAGLDRARPRHAVALAFLAHLGLNVL